MPTCIPIETITQIKQPTINVATAISFPLTALVKLILIKAAIARNGEIANATPAKIGKISSHVASKFFGNDSATINAAIIIKMDDSKHMPASFANKQVLGV
ncbi:MAG: hypothetical protein A2Y07_03545 [Planctomycetes bacterium GWF2_50_10]|nr:MAG: hypothetical protein A2Y07_03545 [Planctomycetes bacterium GWF2_50_10]